MAVGLAVVVIEALQVRLEAIATDFGRRIQLLEDAKPEVVASQVNDLKIDMRDMKDEFKSLKRALYGFAFSVAGGAVIFAFTAFQVWG